MKKVLSLLLVCVMLLSFALVANAAGEGYTVTNGSINATHGRFYLNVASKTIANSGYMTIKYDASKVTLLKQVKTPTGEEDDEGNPIMTTTYEEVTNSDTSFAVGQGGAAFASQAVDVNSAQVVVQWFNTSKVQAGANIFRLWFKAADNAGNNFDETTFTVVTDDAFLNANAAYKGSVRVVTDTADLGLTNADVTWSYKNADVKVEVPEEPEVPETPSYSATEEEVNAKQDWTSGEFKYPTDKVGGTDNAAVGKKVAAFGKAGTALTDGNYGIKIGNRFYPGRIDVPQGSYFAIIVVNTNGDDAIEDSYTYDIYTGTDADPTWVATGLSAVVE